MIATDPSASISDRIVHMKLETGEFAEYPLPSQNSIRRVFVDNSSNPPTFWVGNNHHAANVDGLNSQNNSESKQK